MPPGYPRKRFRGGEFNLSEAGIGAQVPVTFAKDIDISNRATHG